MKKKIKKKRKSKNYNLLLIIVLCIGVILIFAAYAWFYSSLNVNVKFFNMIVSNDSGLSISYDGINFGSSIEISKKILIDELAKTYPSNTSQWAGAGLTPVSTAGILTPNDNKFRVYENAGFKFKDKKKEYRILSTLLMDESRPRTTNYFIAFDLFLKNVTGSPVSDNLFLDNGTNVEMKTGNTIEEMHGLVNSLRIGFLKVGSVPLKSNINQIQNIQCNNNCEAVIYEPNSEFHTNLSIERLEKYGIDLVNGKYFPTYAIKNETYKMDIRNTISGSANMDQNFFQLQNTRTDFTSSLFKIPDGITKIRVYVWIEGQDVDSLESHSHGADLAITLNFVKDEAGYEAFDE